MRPLPPMDTMPRRALHWSRYNLFSSPANTLLTITGVLVLYWTVPGLMHWLWWDAVFDAAHRNECRRRAPAPAGRWSGSGWTSCSTGSIRSTSAGG